MEEEKNKYQIKHFGASFKSKKSPYLSLDDYIIIDNNRVSTFFYIDWFWGMRSYRFLEPNLCLNYARRVVDYLEQHPEKTAHGDCQCL